MSIRSELYWLRKQEAQDQIRNACMDIQAMERVTMQEHPNKKHWLPDGKRMKEAVEEFSKISF